MYARRCKFEVLWKFFGPAIYWWGGFLKDVFNEELKEMHVVFPRLQSRGNQN